MTAGEIHVGQLSQQAGREGVDEDLVGLQAAQGRGQPAPVRRRVGDAARGHGMNRERPHHARIARVRRRREQRRVALAPERVQHRARPHQMAKPAAHRVVEDHRVGPGPAAQKPAARISAITIQRSRAGIASISSTPNAAERNPAGASNRVRPPAS